MRCQASAGNSMLPSMVGGWLQPACAATTMGCAAVPEAPRRKVSAQRLPQASSTRSPGASAAAASRVRLRQGRSALWPSWVSSPVWLSTWKRRAGAGTSGHGVARGGAASPATTKRPSVPRGPARRPSRPASGSSQDANAAPAEIAASAASVPPEACPTPAAIAITLGGDAAADSPGADGSSDPPHATRVHNSRLNIAGARTGGAMGRRRPAAAGAAATARSQ